MDCHTPLASTRFRYPEIADLFLDEPQIANGRFEGIRRWNRTLAC